MAQVAGLPDLQTAQQQYQQQEERDRSNMPQYTDEVYLTPSHTATEKSLGAAAALLYIPFMGLFGAHHFYLRRRFYGILYACTAGLFFLGWMADWCRIGSLVRKCNKDASEARAKGHWLHSKKFPDYLSKKTFLDALILWLPPFGIFGAYHFYLGRKRYGTFHACTFGSFLVGWLIDLFRLSYMVEKANTDIMLMKKGTRVGEDPYKTSDAYLMALPFGVFGLHHFYMSNKSRGLLYLCTFGVFGIGWVTDFVQMPLIVKEANKNRELRERLQHALTQGPPQDTAIVLNVIPPQTNQGFEAEPGGIPPGQPGNDPEPPPMYSEDAVEGETVIIEGADTASQQSSLPGPSVDQGNGAVGVSAVALPPKPM